jgi:hypothetical protein
MKIWHFVIPAVVLVLSMNQANAQGTNLTNFPQLVDAVEKGDDVRAIIHFERCLVTDPTLPTQTIRQLAGATTRFNFTHYFRAKLTINDQLIDTVTTSMKIFIERPAGQFLTLSGRLSVFEDNTARLHVDLLDPILHKSIFGINWLCTISDGQDNNGLMLFDVP